MTRLTDERLTKLTDCCEPISHAEVVALVAEVRASRASPGLREAANEAVEAFMDCDSLPVANRIERQTSALMALRAALSSPGTPATALCAGCNVRPPFEHRCHGAPCPCTDCDNHNFRPAPSTGTADGEDALAHAFRPGLANNPHGWAPPLSARENTGAPGTVNCDGRACGLPNCLWCSGLQYAPGETVMNLYDKAREEGRREGWKAAIDKAAVAGYIAARKGIPSDVASAIRALAAPHPRRAGTSGSTPKPGPGGGGQGA